MYVLFDYILILHLATVVIGLCATLSLESLSGEVQMKKLLFQWVGISCLL